MQACDCQLAAMVRLRVVALQTVSCIGHRYKAIGKRPSAASKDSVSGVRTAPRNLWRFRSSGCLDCSYWSMHRVPLQMWQGHIASACSIHQHCVRFGHAAYRVLLVVLFAGMPTLLTTAGFSAAA
jgi:hypothetical protein